ncbi:MAG: sigma-70 family RNA polymerase sigma factor [Ruthenibacterium sp.]
MAKFLRIPNYREMYPDASDEVIKCLRKSHRKMEYAEYDLKAERIRVDAKKQKVIFIPSREDSLERLMDEDKQFQDTAESPEDMAIKAVMIAKMMECVALLSDAERELITELFFNEKSQRNLCEKYRISQPAIKKRQDKILAKLKKMMNI